MQCRRSATVQKFGFRVAGYRPNVDAQKLGQAGLVGWRRKIGERVAEPVSRRTGLSFDQALAIVGGLFFVLTVRRLVRMLAAAREARD
jgi:hypothetical protein